MKAVIAASLALILTACGGGGSDSSAPPIQSSSSSSTQPSNSSVSSSSSSSSSSESSSSSSESSSSEISTINPLPPGAGLYSTRFVHGETYLIDQDTGITEVQPNPLQYNYRAADLSPSGHVIAVRAGSFNAGAIDKIDFISGNSEYLFDAPEGLSSLAVDADGVVVGVSSEGEFDTKTVYRMSMSGEVLGQASTDLDPGGIDFMPDGTLIALGLMGTYTLDPETGAYSFLYGPTPGSQSDIDIDSSGVLRLIWSGDELELYDIEGDAALGKTLLQYDYFSFSPLVYR